ncbi:MAG: peptidase C69 [bacterium]|nr:MAG: peptidase C69 [bacterium]
MKSFTDRALNIAQTKGAKYCDIRIVETKNEGIQIKNGHLGGLTQEKTLGFGIRVIVNGAWGFASSSDLTYQEIENITAQACEIAKASSLLMDKPVILSEDPSYTDFWQTPFQINPFKVSLEDKLKLLYEIDAILSKDKRITSTYSSLRFKNEHKWFASSEGSYIEQNILRSGGGYSCTASGNGDSQIRSYPASFGGQFKSMGYELIESLRLLENAEGTREEAISLLTADPVPKGEKDIILMGNQMVLQIHESVGHPTELDRVLGFEANYAGTSFATTEKLHTFRYGSDIVNLVADNTVPTGLATQGYDDDGVQAKRWHIVKDGILSGYMTNRETACAAGEDESKGCNRAEGFQNIPITRIANLSLMPGTDTLESLIEGIDDGILMDTNKSWSIDQRRLNFQFGCEIAWEIKKGKLGRILKNPVYQGITPEFWASCDGIANYEHWDLWGVMNCGKGQPGQTNYMSHGSSPARFRSVSLGG